MIRRAFTWCALAALLLLAGCVIVAGGEELPGRS